MSQEQKDAIIKKQKASIEKYRKKAEKLRAQLEEGEKDAASAIKAEDTQIGTPASASDDDFVKNLWSLLLDGPRRRIKIQNNKNLKSHQLTRKLLIRFMQNSKVNTQGIRSDYHSLK